MTDADILRACEELKIHSFPPIDLGDGQRIPNWAAFSKSMKRMKDGKELYGQGETMREAVIDLLKKLDII